MGAILILFGALIATHAIFQALYPYYRLAQSFDLGEVGRHRAGCEVVDSLDRPIGRIFSTNVTPISTEDIPPHLLQALIATEDT
ncbi:MAG: penicillin-binding protein, partial [Verrucomicrobiota bacterium]